MLTRKQALLALALMTSLPLAVWAHADNDNFGGPGQGYGPGMMQGQGYGSGMMQGQGYGPGMMQGQGYGFGMMQGQGYGPGMMQGYGPFGYMNDTDNLKAQLDSIKDPKVKAKYIEMIKARMAFEQSQLDATKAFLDSQK